MKNISDVLKESNSNETFIIEQKIMTENAVGLDSLFNKWQTYNYNLANNSRIYEGFEDNYDINLTSAESKAASDVLIYFCESLINEYNEELRQIEINEGFKDWIKNAKDKISEKYKEITAKIKGLTELIKNFKEKAFNTIKELAQKFGDFLVTCALSLVQLIEKLKGDPEEEAKTYCKMVSEQAKNINVEEIKKNSLFEDAVNYLNGETVINEDLLNEGIFGSLFGKKKKNDDASDEEKNYDQQAAEKEGSKKGGWKKTLFAAIKQMAIYYTLTVIIPLALTAIPGIGVGLGAMFGTIAKLTWGAVGMAKQIQMFIKLVKSDQWKHHMKKSTKIFRILLFLFSLYFAGKAIKVAGSDLIAQVGTIKEFGLKKALTLIAPDRIVEKLAKLIDGLSKKCGGSGFAGWDNIQAARDSAFQEYEKLVDITTKEPGTVSSAEVEAANKKLQSIDKLGSKWWQEVKSRVYADRRHPENGFSDNVNEYVPERHGITDGDYTAGGHNGETAKFAEQVRKLGYNPDEMVTQHSLGGGQGSYVEWNLEGVSPEHLEILQNYSLKNAGVIVNGTTKMVDVASQVAQTITEPIAQVVATAVPFAGLMPILKNKSGYKLRLGSTATKSNYVYKIEKYEEVSYDDLKNGYGKNNSKVFEGKGQQDDILKKTQNDLNNAIEKLEKDGGDKKALKALKKGKEKFEDTLKSKNCIVLMGKKLSKSKPVKDSLETNKKSLKDYICESKVYEAEEESKLIPVMFINPLLMCAGDLAECKKGTMRKMYYLKGILANIEILTEEGGLSHKDVLQMFVKIMQESIKANLNMVVDVPCYKKDGDKKYVVNDKSVYKDKKRPDFGNFTNEEITEIVNDKNKAGEYLGGEHYTKKNQTLEKEKKEDNVKKFKKYMEEDDDIKDYLEKHPKLKKYFYKDGEHIDDGAFDSAYDILSRAEKAYVSGKTKKGLFSRIKDFFSGKHENEGKNEKKLRHIDPDELSALATLIAKARQKKSKNGEEQTHESLIHPLYPGCYAYIDNTQINESVIEDIIFEANMETIIAEFNEWLENESIFDEEEPLFE